MTLKTLKKPGKVSQKLLATLIMKFCPQLKESRFTLMFTSETDLNYQLWTVLSSSPPENRVARLTEVLEGGSVEVKEESRDTFKQTVR